MTELQEKSDGARLKGEITMVVAPGISEEIELQKIAKGTGFDPQRDTIQKVDAIQIAKNLQQKVEMGDSDFRDLLKSIFPEMPSYHIDALVKIAKKKERKEPVMDRLTRIAGGVM